MIRRLFSKIPRDRTLLLLLAPVVAIAAIGGAALLDKGPTPATVRAGTTTTVAKGEQPESKVAGETTVPDGDAGTGGSSADGSGDAVALGEPDLSAEANSDYRGDVPPGADVLDSNLTAPTTVPTTLAPTTTVPGQPTTTLPGGSTTSTTTTTPSPTTTVPGPPPVVSESPVAALLPLSALLAVGLAVGLLFRRRRRQEPAAK